MTVEQSTDASFDRPTDWKSIDWTSIEKQVRRLQVRIAKAVQASKHRRAKALQWLRTAAEDGFPCYPLFELDPNLNNLRQDPGFLAFMKSLKEQWERYNATL